MCAGLPAPSRARPAAVSTPKPSIANELVVLCRPYQPSIADTPSIAGTPSIAPLRTSIADTPSIAGKPYRPAAQSRTAGIFLPGGAKKAWEAAAKWPGRGRITSPAAIKTAASNSLKTAADKPVANTVRVDKSTGLAYFRHADGRMSPRAL